jgi:hypothetical protein
MFRTGRCPILVATAVAARGKSIFHHVVHYFLMWFTPSLPIWQAPSWSAPAYWHLL